MKVEPSCYPETPAVQLRQELWQTMKRNSTPPFLERKVQSLQGVPSKRLRDVQLLALNLLCPSPTAENPVGPELSEELIPDATNFFPPALLCICPHCPQNSHLLTPYDRVSGAGWDAETMAWAFPRPFHSSRAGTSTITHIPDKR